MNTNYSISIVHPSFELLKNAARLLHFTAAAFIMINAIHQLSAHEGGHLICFAQLLIASDIFILVFFGAGILATSAKTGVIFRGIEALTFLGMFLTLAVEDHLWLGLIHAVLAGIYTFLFYREWRISKSEAILLKPSGVKIPNFFADAEFKWLHIKKVVAGYNSIIIETVRYEKVKFELRNNLKIEELEQINDFCIFHSQMSG